MHAFYSMPIDVWESGESKWDDSGNHGWPQQRSYSKWHYFTQLKYTEVKQQTEKAILMLVYGKELWLPKSLLKEWDTKNKTFRIHKDTLLKIIKDKTK